jgi:uncharacterized protein YutD
VKEKSIVDLINKTLDERLKGVKAFNDSASFTGYNPIEKIRGGLFHWIAVPFNGVDVFCQLRCPNATQIEQCGDISNITLDVKNGKKMGYEEIIQIRNYQEALCKITFNVPTFDHIAEVIGRDDFVISEKKAELEKIKGQYEENRNKLSEVEKKSVELKIKTIELQLGYILPDDTMAFVTRWAMGNDISDIKKITKEIFLRAAYLARAHNKAPTDYISGVFTDHNKREVDAYAIKVLEDYLSEQKVIQEGKGKKYQWFLGGRKGGSGFISRNGSK